MDKNGNITLSYETWKNGIQTPLTGMGDIVNIDIFEEPGVAKIDFMPTELIGEEDVTDQGTTYAGSCAIDTSGQAVIGTSEGDVLVQPKEGGAVVENNGTSAGDFQHAVEWKGYTIFADYDNNSNRMKVSAYATGLAGDNIEYGFESMPTSSLAGGSGQYRFSRGALVVGYDDILYVGSGKYVGSLTEDTTFDPTDNGTYTWNAQALDLPDGYEIDSLVNFNDFLMIFAGNPETREQAIFPWDRVSASYNYPIHLNNGVASQASASQNLAFFLNGTRGKFSVTNRSTVGNVIELNNLVFPTRTAGISQHPGAITLLDDILIIGVSNDVTGVSPVGIYKIKDNKYVRQTLSTGDDGSADNIRIHFVRPFEYNNFLVGWQNVTDTTWGVEEFGLNGYRVTGYGAYMESPLYKPGLVLNDKSYGQIEVVLAKELATDQGIRVSYRENLTDDWTVLGTYDFATYGAVAKINESHGIHDMTTIQLKVEMTTGSSSTATPELISVSLM